MMSTVVFHGKWYVVSAVQPDERSPWMIAVLGSSNGLPLRAQTVVSVWLTWNDSVVPAGPGGGDTSASNGLRSGASRTEAPSIADPLMRIQATA